MPATPERRSLLGELKRRHVFRVGATYVFVAFVVLQAAQLFGEALSLPDWTLPLVTVLALLGFPISLVLAWAYELTDRGVVKDAEISPAPAPAETPLLLSADDVEPRSIAVLPFANLSGEEDSEYFSDGVTEDIITTLSRIRDLKVVSRTSVMRYKESKESIRQIAKTLGVASVLEGSVRRAGDRVRISAQLIDAVEDRHLWAETYEHRLEDIFGIQSDVSRHIANALAAELSPEESEDIDQRPTTDVAAYDAYLKGRHLWSRRTAEGIQKSIDYYDRALELDADFALAEAGRADSYVTLGLYGVSDPSHVMPLAREAASRALSINPRTPEALTSLATVRGLHDWDWPASEQDFQRAIDLQPRYPVAHHWYASNLLTPQGRFAEARTALNRALEIDPLSEAVATSLGVVSLYSGDFARALTQLDQVLDVHDHFGMAYFFRGQALAGLGRWDEALEALGSADEFTGSSVEVRATQGHALAASGRHPAAREILAELNRRCLDRYCSPVLRAQVHLGLDEPEEALDLLEAAAEVRAVDLVWLAVRPIYEPLRGQPRYARLLKTVGLPGSDRP